MNSSKTGRNTTQRWFVFLVLVSVPLVAAANDKKPSTYTPPRAGYTPPKASAPAHVAPRPAPHVQASAPRHANAIPKNTTQGSTGTATRVSGFNSTGHTTPTSATLATRARPSMQTPSAHIMPAHTMAGSLGHTVSLRNGGTATVNSNGNVRSIQTSGMTINHGAQGQRQIVTERNGQRLVSTGPNQGYSQRQYVSRNGQTYVQRTYVANNVTYTRVYTSYTYSGVTYYNYVPVVYYRPAFYGWVYNPWVAPVYYSWGWYGAPWYASYGYYYAPAPVYSSPSLWLTDYLLAENLKLAYQAQANANTANQAQSNAQAYAQPNTPAPQPSQRDNVALSPEVKQAIAEEVKAELAAEQAASATTQPTSLSQNQPPPALDPSHRVFVVAGNLAASSDTGQECALTSGDIITRVTDTPNKDQKVTVLITTSKKTDCATGLLLAVPVQELQEMHNHFREQVDSGLKILADSKGTGGLPAAPDTHVVNGEVPQPPPDAGIEARLQAQQFEADRLEADVRRQTAGGQGAGS